MINRNFLFLWGSQLLSQLTIQVMNFLLLVRLFDLTGSTIATAFFWIAFSIPAIIMGPIGAAFVDVVDRKKTLQVTNILQALTILIFAFTFEKNIFLAYYVVFFYSLFNQFYVPAEAASLPRLVAKEKLPLANSIFFITQQVSIILGFGLAGGLSSLLGYQTLFVSSSVLLILAFVSVSFLPKIVPKKIGAKRFEEKLSKFFAKIGEGYVFIKNHKDILLPIILLMGLHSAVAVVTVNLPVMATQLLGVTASLSGLFVVAPAGVGALIGSLTVSKVLKRRTVRKKYIIEGSALGLGLSLVAGAILLPVLAPLARIVVAVGVFAVVGAAYVGLFIPAQTYLQEATPDSMTGRVFGNFWFMATIAAIIPVLFSGAIVEILGARSVIILIALGAFSIFYFSKKSGQKILERNSRKNAN